MQPDKLLVNLEKSFETNIRSILSGTRSVLWVYNIAWTVKDSKNDLCSFHNDSLHLSHRTLVSQIKLKFVHSPMIVCSLLRCTPELQFDLSNSYFPLFQTQNQFSWILLISHLLSAVSNYRYFELFFVSYKGK